jgi:hypothetical protein
VGFTENDKLCFFFFLLFPLPATAPKKPNVPHHFVNNSSGFRDKWTRMPRAIPPPKIDKIASKLATHIEGNNFFLTPAGGFVGFTENNKLCFLFFLLFPLPATAENDSNKTPRLSPFC